MPPGAVRAAVLINLAAYHLAYVVTLAGALAILQWQGHPNLVVVLGTLLFMLFALALAGGIVAGSGRPDSPLVSRLRRMAVVQRAIPFVAEADARLVRSIGLLTVATALQVAISLLDTATMWTLLRSLGAYPSVKGVFASFMVASLVRTLGVVPGGLGTFEAAAVVTLTLTGTPVPVALTATLLFRGLSFWAPMVPGLILLRRAFRTPDATTAADQQVAY